MAKQLKAWGIWDDAPRWVLADEMTQAEAARYLEELEGNDEIVAVPVGEKPVRDTVWDCEFNGPKPCGDPDCRHDHEELLWEFEMRYRDEVD